MASKDFDADREQGELHEFTLGGKKFHLKPHFPPNTFVDERDYKGLQGVLNLLRKCIVPADREEFERVLDADDVFIGEVDIFNVSTWYIEVVTGRPTSGSSQSPTGPEPTSDTSEDRLDSPVAATTG